MFDTNEKNILAESTEFSNFVTNFKSIWELLKENTVSIINEFKQIVEDETINKKNNYPTPLLYTAPSIDTCITCKYKFENEYDKFYNIIDKNRPLEFLFKIMTSPADKTVKYIKGTKQIDYGINGFGLQIEKATIVLFTVINLTPNPIEPTNNPPTPPFININKLN